MWTLGNYSGARNLDRLFLKRVDLGYELNAFSCDSLGLCPSSSPADILDLLNLTV